VEEIDIWRAARLLIQQHGMAPSGKQLERGDARGERVWCNALKAIETLMDIQPSGPLN